MANPRWSEDPSYLLEQVRTLLDRRDIPGGREQAAARRGAAEAEVARLPFWLRPIVRWLAARARRAAALREAGKSALVSTLVLSRKMMAEVGGRMVAAGLLDDPERRLPLGSRRRRRLGDGRVGRCRRAGAGD